MERTQSLNTNNGASSEDGDSLPQSTPRSVGSLGLGADGTSYESVRAAGVDHAAEVLYRSARELAKYTKLDGRDKIRKNKIFTSRPSMTLEQYKQRVQTLLRATANLHPAHAVAIAQSIQSKYADAPKIVGTLKSVNHEIEFRRVQPADGGLSAETHQPIRVVLYDQQAKFQKLTAMFTNTFMYEAFFNDSYVKQCFEIERLLRGEETEQQRRERMVMSDESQYENVQKLTEMLHQIGGSEGKLSARPGFGGGAMAADDYDLASRLESFRQNQSAPYGEA